MYTLSALTYTKRIGIFSVFIIKETIKERKCKMNKRNRIVILSSFILSVMLITGCSRDQKIPDDSIEKDTLTQDMDTIDNLPLDDNNYDTTNDLYDYDSPSTDSNVDDYYDHYDDKNHHDNSSILDETGEQIKDAFEDVKDGVEDITDDITHDVMDR